MISPLKLFYNDKKNLYFPKNQTIKKMQHLKFEKNPNLKNKSTKVNNPPMFPVKNKIK